MLFHAHIPGFSGGFLGVDVFFVLSGYLITCVLLAAHNSTESPLWRFYERRARRLLPALGLAMAVTIALSATVLVPRLFHALGTQLVATAAFAANLQHARVASYFMPAASESPLLHTWSLAVEEQFYLFYPPLLLWLSARSRAQARGAVLVLTLASLGFAATLQRHNPNLAFYLMPARAWELGVGALLGLNTVPPLRSATARTLASLSGLAAIAMSGAGLFVIEGAPLPVALPCVLGTALVLHAESQDATQVGRWLSWAPLRGLGKISYGLYLWHWPLLVLNKALLWRGLPPPLWASVGVLLVSTVLAAASWHLLEQPLRRSTHSRTQVATASWLGIGAAVATGLLLRVGEGFPQRFTPQTQHFADARSDLDPTSASCSDAGGPAPCHHGPEDAAVDWMVWGDSHASGLIPAVLGALGPDVAVRSLTVDGCGPFLHARRAAIPEHKAQRCHTSHQRVLEEVRRLAPVNVLVHARWGAYADGFLLENNVPWRLVSESDRQSKPFSLESSIAALEQAGATIFLVSSMPAHPMRVPEHLVASAVLGWEPTEMPVAAHRLRNAVPDAEFSRLQSEARVTVIDLTPAFCDDTCALSFRGSSLYRDSNHISAAAAHQLLTPYLRETLSGLVPRAGSTAAPDLRPTPDRPALPSK